MGLSSFDNWFYWIYAQSSQYTTSPESSDYMPNRDYMCSNGYWHYFVGQDKWNVYGFDIDHCLSERVDSQCTLKLAWAFSLSLLLAT